MPVKQRKEEKREGQKVSSCEPSSSAHSLQYSSYLVATTVPFHGLLLLSLLLVRMLLVAMPGTPSSVLAPSSKARNP